LCSPCPAGYMCTRRIAADPCQQGYYCPANTGYNIQPCPIGTFGEKESLTTESDCSNCTGGYYCGSPGLPAPTAECDGGFWCETGVDVKAPSGVGHTGTGGRCFRGHECSRGTSYPVPCKNGYYASAEGISECLLCPSGMIFNF